MIDLAHRSEPYEIALPYGLSLPARPLTTAGMAVPRPQPVVPSTVHDPWHYVPVLARKPGALRNGAPFKAWLLPAALEQVRRKLAKAPGGDRQMVDILSVVLTDGLAAVEAACAEALAEGVHSADVVLNILARRREPGPPLAITTPDALRLRCEPAADCARYDRLRRAI